MSSQINNSKSAPDILAKGLELINASAGSGKTYTLAERVLTVLGSGITPDMLGATTFTNKAAAELRERMRLKLIEQEMQQTADHISEGFIGTVNSICARLLKEYAIDAGLSPAIDVLPEEDADRLFRVAASNTMQAHASKIEPLAYRLSRDDQGTKYERHDWQEDVRRLVSLARVNLLDRPALLRSAESSKRSVSEMLGDPLPESHFNPLDAEVQSALEQLQTLTKLAKKTIVSIQSLKRFLRVRRRNQKIRWAEWQPLAKLDVQVAAKDVIFDVCRIAEDLPSHPAFQKDMFDMIDAVFTCAADALEAYEQYKLEHGLMDFTDQETRVLQLARQDESFRESMRLRLRHMMVDEFQDTNPTQLALFLQLHGFAETSVWVGDPKQSIYGFRDADPRLMEQASVLSTSQSTLPYSWRSKRELVDFTNAVFVGAFHDMPPEHVSLEIPSEREGVADGGWIESWLLVGGKKRERDNALAQEIVRVLERKDLSVGDVAVLCRSHSDCRSVATALESHGLRASASRGRLVEAPECRLAMAALRVMQDQYDSIALAALMRYTADTDTDDWLTSLLSSPEETKQAWRASSLAGKLSEEAARLSQRTPAEALEAAIDAVGMENVLMRWGNGEVRRGNLDLLRKLCDEYLDHCRSRRSAATVHGFISFAEASDRGEAEGIGADTIKVLTYHAAKGLEWPVVVLHSLHPQWRANAYGVSIEGAEKFDPEDPLAGRSIRYWPWPFAAKGGTQSFATRADTCKETVEAVLMEQREEIRKLYVGMTRARDGLILAAQKKVSKAGNVTLSTRWLDLLKDSKEQVLLQLPAERGKHTLHIGKAKIPIESFECLIDENDKNGSRKPPKEYRTTYEPTLLAYPPSRLTPSRDTEGENATITFKAELRDTINGSILIHGNPNEQHLGSCIHAFLALDRSAMKKDRSMLIAESLIRRWEVEAALAPDDLLSMAVALEDWIAQTYPGSTLHREMPLTFTDAEHRTMAGRADLLIETKDGWVVLDHKSIHTVDQERVQPFARQLQAYATALSAATNRSVVELLLHLPLVGELYAITGH